MTGVADHLTAKLGPLPVWAWGVGLGVAVNIGRHVYASRKPAVPPTPDATDAGGDGMAAGGSAAGGSVGLPPGPGMPAVGVPNSGGWGGPASDPAGGNGATVPSGPQSNPEWQARAVEAVTADGYSPLDVETALSLYLAGQPISAKQQAIVSIAFRHLGRPPEGAPTITTAPDQPAGGGMTQPGPPQAPQAPPPAAWSPPSWLAGVQFVKGSGPAIYHVLPGQGLEWIPSPSAFMALGGHGPGFDTSPANYITVADAALRPLPRVGTLPDRVYDPSLP